jgi:Skp family chaperone for outer membrane proteins
MKKWIFAALISGIAIVSLNAQSPGIRVWDQNMRGAAANLAALVDQYKEQLRQEQIKRIEEQRQEAQRKWAEEVAEETYQRYTTDPEFKKECDETKARIDKQLAEEKKRSLFQQAQDEQEQRQKEQEPERGPIIKNAEGPYYEEQWDYVTHLLSPPTW